MSGSKDRVDILKKPTAKRKLFIRLRLSAFSRTNPIFRKQGGVCESFWSTSFAEKSSQNYLASKVDNY